MPCRHLGSVPLTRLPQILSTPTLPASCVACPSPSLICLTCGERQCPAHFFKHAKQKNHPIAFAQEGDGTGKLFCGNCGGEPEVRSVKEKKTLASVLEAAKGALLSGENNAKSSDNARNTRTENSSNTKNTRTENSSNTSNSSHSTPVGLSNLGNTCFMNATLQSLNAVLPTSFKSSHSASSKTLSTLSSTLSQLSASKQKTIVPRDLLNAVSARYRKFALLQQQDAHDFLRCLFNCIKEELPKSSEDPLRVLAGRMISRVRCGRCRRVSDTEEPFLDISLSLVDDSDRSLEADLSELCLDGTSDADFSIEQLLAAWSKPCELKGENGYHCESCSPQDTSCLQDATLTFKLLQLPQVLIIHLQRFKTFYKTGPASSATAGKAKKKNRNDNDSFYLQVQKDHRSVKYPLHLKVPESALHDPEAEIAASYELAAFIEHDGACTSSGHYTAMVRHGDCWYHASDTRVTGVGEARALDFTRNQPYLLFYRLENKK